MSKGYSVVKYIVSSMKRQRALEGEIMRNLIKNSIQGIKDFADLTIGIVILVTWLIVTAIKGGENKEEWPEW